MFPYSPVPTGIDNGHWVIAVSPGFYTEFVGTDEVLTPSVFVYNVNTSEWDTYPLYYGATGDVDLINYSDYAFHKAGEDFVYYKNTSSTDKSYTVPFIYKCTVNTIPGQSPESTPGKWERISVYIDVEDVENRLLALEENNDEVVAHLTDYDNPHQVTKLQVGLSDVDNTSDAIKPISVYTQAALDLKTDIGHTHVAADITDLTVIETDPIFVASPANDITTTDITNLSNLSGINTGDQDLSNYTQIGHTHSETDITDLDKYTQLEVDTLLLGKSDIGHDHSGVYEPANSNIQTHISALVAHGTVGSIVGTSDLQTLTNKTLNNDTVSGYLKFDPLNTCLLYTSPSPRDKRQSRMPSSA